MRTQRALRRPFAFLALCALAIVSASMSVPAQAAPPPVAGAPVADAPEDDEKKRKENQNKRRERSRRERERRSANLRRVMGSMGISDRAVQDEVMRHIGQETRERAQLRRKVAEIYAALRDPARSDEDVRGLLASYQALVAADRSRRRVAEDALNERIGFRTKPRLEAMLTLFGVIGDSPIILPANTRRG